MLKILGIILLVLIFFVLLALMLFTSLIMSFIRRIREMIGQQDSANNHDSRDYTGRRRQQYAYRDRPSDSQQQWQQSSSTPSQDETIVDTRSQNRSGKKIFDDNEGEYVDFVEE